MIRTIVVAFAVVVFTFTAAAQTPFSDIGPASFQGLELDDATVADTTSVLGQPHSDRENARLEGVSWFKHWFTPHATEKTLRRLTYKKLGGFDEVKLFFSKENLVAVNATLPSPFVNDNPFLSPNDLEPIFGDELRTFRWAFGRKLPPMKDFSRTSDHKLEEGPFYYLRIGINDRSVVSNSVNNNNENLTKGFLSKRLSPTKKKWDEINNRGIFPGYVDSIQIISRKITVHP